MGKICFPEKPLVCLECISGDTTGDMLQCLTYGSTLLLYGILSDKPAGNIQTIHFIGKAQTIESFLLNSWLAKKDRAGYIEIFNKAQKMYKTMLKTDIQAKFGLHQIEEAIKFYLKNQTGGKIVLKPSLTNKDEPSTVPVNLDMVVAKL